MELISKAHGTLHYKAKIIGNIANDDRLSIKISSPLTQQNIEIVIQSAYSLNKCSSHPLPNITNTFMEIISNFGLIISTLISLAGTIWGKCLYRI